jgi:hypothetical protein
MVAMSTSDRGAETPTRPGERDDLDGFRLPAWFEERDLASRWNISHFTVQRMRKAGKLKAKKIGNRWKYREDWVREYEDQEDTQCPQSSGLESGSLIGDPIAPSGARANTIPKPDRQDVHRSAQVIFKAPRSDLPNTSPSTRP